MTKYKISFHSGQVSTFAINEFESKEEAKSHYEKMILDSTSPFLSIGDVLIAIDRITFVVVEELIEKVDEPATEATIEC